MGKQAVDWKRVASRMMRDAEKVKECGLCGLNPIQKSHIDSLVQENYRRALKREKKAGKK